MVHAVALAVKAGKQRHRDCTRRVSVHEYINPSCNSRHNDVMALGVRES
jgi:hypothetical protein